MRALAFLIDSMIEDILRNKLEARAQVEVARAIATELTGVKDRLRHDLALLDVNGKVQNAIAAQAVKLSDRIEAVSDDLVKAEKKIVNLETNVKDLKDSRRHWHTNNNTFWKRLLWLLFGS